MDLRPDVGAVTAACELDAGSRVARRSRRIVAWGAVAATLFAAAFLAVVGPQIEWRRAIRREHCAIQWLWDLSAAQSQFRASALLDRDRDSQGESGFFTQVAGCMREPKHGVQYRNCICRTEDLRRAFAQVEHGRVRLNGYVFELWLPAEGGGWVNERDVQDGRAVDVDTCETGWICYAWPEVPGSSGKCVFLLDAGPGGGGGDVRVFTNHGHRYGGENGPIPGVSCFVGREPGASLVTHGEDCLGDVWTIRG
jgi:hypothetical protein